MSQKSSTGQEFFRQCGAGSVVRYTGSLDDARVIKKGDEGVLFGHGLNEVYVTSTRELAPLISTYKFNGTFDYLEVSVLNRLPQNTRYYALSLSEVEAVVPKKSKPKHNSTCRLCGGPALALFSSSECFNSGCPDGRSR